ncbi:spinster family MFS transporter [Tengunoibacter tsumagoiensis]|uniref:MFS transporter n=1 Tax=Tengunoibacter tsumagoiensis TaxID=2014871 RepID=A0A402A4K2_9CHLR|nr:MFS transporter [Tengunoibacter tsumagoiensis]GCE14073.1 MFS transporter [Tengunoibacter tsumagoiensis]
MNEALLSGDERRSSERSARSSYPRYVFLLLFFISFFNYVDRFVLTGAANGIAHELGFSLDGIGYISSAFLVVYTFACVPLGIWADAGKRKDVIAFSVAFWSLSTALTALANSFATLFLARMLLGMGEAGYFPAGTALLSDYFQREKRSRVMSLWSIAELFGVLIGFAIGGAFTSPGLVMGSWRIAFLLTGIPGLILAFFSWRLREPRRNQADEEATLDVLPAEQARPVHLTRSNVLLQMFSLLRIKTLVTLIFVQIFAFFVIGVTISFLPTYLQQKDTYGFTPGLAGLYSGGLLVIAGGIGALVGGYVSDLLGRRYPGARVLVCGYGFLLAAPSMAVVLLCHNIYVFTTFFLLTSLLLRCYNGPYSAAVQDVVPAVLRASAISLTLLLGHLFGDAFAPAIVGIMATNIDPTHGQHFHANLAGQDLGRALLITCVPALVLAGLSGILGSRWMQSDVLAAERTGLALSQLS